MGAYREHVLTRVAAHVPGSDSLPVLRILSTVRGSTGRSEAAGLAVDSEEARAALFFYPQSRLGYPAVHDRLRYRVRISEGDR